MLEKTSTGRMNEHHNKQRSHPFPVRAVVFDPTTTMCPCSSSSQRQTRYSISHQSLTRLILWSLLLLSNQTSKTTIPTTTTTTITTHYDSDVDTTDTTRPGKKQELDDCYSIVIGVSRPMPFFCLLFLLLSSFSFLGIFMAREAIGKT